MDTGLASMSDKAKNGEMYLIDGETFCCKEEKKDSCLSVEKVQSDEVNTGI